ncbi:MAG: hypothetical protein AMJ54_08070 [Deltaproteobacteria bacterium SG8_13]|nr:MAG: hypothetical protein AMJ54_08070 [Deltaproteobacteria bacterium SG8_13]
MEVKWNRVKGRFSHKAHLRRLAGLQKRNLKKTFQQAELPSAWEKALGGYDVSGFSWQSESISGKGVLIYGPESRAATLIQFYRQDIAGVETAASRLLASFRDRISGEVMPWEVFDIRATIPIDFALQRFRFEAGQYELNFSSRREQLRMIRWSPAAVLLRRQDLATMARGSFFSKDKQEPQWLQSDAATVEGQMTPTSIAALAASRIRRRPAYRLFRLWHEIDKNRILGVLISGRNSIDRRKLSAICEKYETV